MKFIFRITIIILILSSSLQQAVAEQVSIDSIVAIVDEDVISKRELETRIELISNDLDKTSRNLPEPEALYRQVLEIMISDSVLLQKAKGGGIKITDGAVKFAENLNVGELLTSARQSCHYISQFLADRRRAGGLAVGAGHHCKTGVLLTHRAKFGRQFTHLRLQHIISCRS